MTGLTQDVRYAVRQLAKAPMFTAVAVITLALGIGANTAIFNLFDQVLLRRLPVRDPQQLVQLEHSGKDSGRLSAYGGSSGDYFSYPVYRDLRDGNSVFSGVLATDSTQTGVQWHNQPALADTELVSGNYFDVLGVRPALGRLFVQGDDVTENANPVVVLSFAYWQRRMGSDPKILDQTILINGHPFTVIGVAQPGFHSVVVGNSPALFAPMMMKSEIMPCCKDLDDRLSRWLNIVARLKPGVSRIQAEAGMNTLWRALRSEEVKAIQHRSAAFQQQYVQSHLKLADGALGFSPLRQNIRAPLLIVMGMVGLVMLMACVNVASLLLVRSAGRVREISVRYALGARRGRIGQQLLVEGLLLGLAGGALGIILAPPVSALLLRRMMTDVSGDLPFSATPDLRIFAFNFALAIGVSLLFGLAPALQFWRPDLTPMIKQQNSTATAGAMRFRRISVGVQIGLSLLLLVGSGLFLHTLYNLRTLDVGFSTDHLITFGIDAKLAGYDQKDVPALFQRVLNRLRELPATQSVAATNDPVLAGNTEGRNITIPGYVAKEDEDMDVEWSLVTEDYFRTLQMPLVAGRSFSSQDGPQATPVAIVNESLARHYWGDAQRALGQHFVPGGGHDSEPGLQIVGVSQDAKHEDMRGAVRRSVFVPYLQAKEAGNVPLQFYVRTQQTPQSAQATIRGAMQNFDSKLVLDTMRTMDEQIDDNLSTERMIALLATSFGVLATLLAAVGLYGVLAYATVQRTREIGIRIALGATRGMVARMVLSEVFWLVGVSLAIALPLALLLSRLLKSQLFGISNNDPLTLCLGTALIGLVALLAAYVPAWRAARVDPTVALRYE
jgi:putative ABC transport system permease protein